jgi:sugar/nucleoside kinase (ribokinase family)
LLGGSAAHFSLAAAHLARVGVVGVVGDDFPAPLWEQLAVRGIDLRGVERLPGATFAWEAEYAADMTRRRTLRTALGVFEGFRPTLPAAYRDTRALFLANIDPQLQLAVLDQTGAGPLIALDTMNFWIEGQPEAVRRVIARAHILLVNDEEAMLLSGLCDPHVAARRIREMGPEVVVVKKGPGGAAALGPWGWLLFPAVPVEILRDPTGAGDAFAGGLVGYLAGRDWRDRDRFAEGMAVGTALASLVVEDYGSAALRRARGGELTDRCALLRAAMHFEVPGIL